MADFESYEMIITQLNELTHKLTKGQLNEDDMHRFVEQSRKLYERTVIMQYKAIEAKVYGEEKAAEEMIASSAVEDALEEQQPEPVAQKVDEKSQKSASDFDSGILFDFSSDLTDALQEPVKMEEESEINDSNDKEEVVEITPAEEVVPESPVSHSTTQTVHADGTTVTSFYRRFEEVHNDIVANKLSNPKIDSIRSAFGLNDRLQIISELFSGDSETFSKTVEELEGVNSSDIARKKLSEIAVQYRWDAENKLVEEFVRIVDRKFV